MPGEVGKNNSGKTVQGGPGLQLNSINKPKRAFSGRKEAEGWRQRGEKSVDSVGERRSPVMGRHWNGGDPREQVRDPGRGEPNLESKMEGRSVFPSCLVMGTLQRAFTRIISSKPVQSEK